MTENAGSRVDDAPLSPFHKKLALYSSGGPFLDGYVLSIIGVAMVQITPQLDLSDSAQGLIGASALIGIFLGTFVGGWLTDRFGRQLLYTIDLIAIIVCSVAQFWAADPVWLFILRLLIGMAVGADYPSPPRCWPSSRRAATGVRCWAVWSSCGSWARPPRTSSASSCCRPATTGGGGCSPAPRCPPRSSCCCATARPNPRAGWRTRAAPTRPRPS